MNSRQLRAEQIVADGNITVGPGYYSVGSQYGAGRHRVVVDGLFPSCSCDDFEATGRDCKHLLAVRQWLEVKAGAAPAPKPEVVAEPVPRKTYPQRWKEYNLAATTEKAWFISLLVDLTSAIPEPERVNQRGRPIPMRDALF